LSLQSLERFTKLHTPLEHESTVQTSLSSQTTGWNTQSRKGADTLFVWHTTGLHSGSVGCAAQGLYGTLVHEWVQRQLAGEPLRNMPVGIVGGERMHVSSVHPSESSQGLLAQGSAGGHSVHE